MADADPPLDPNCLENCMTECKKNHYDIVCDVYCSSLKCSPGSTIYTKKVCIQILFWVPSLVAEITPAFRNGKMKTMKTSLKQPFSFSFLFFLTI